MKDFIVLKSWPSFLPKSSFHLRYFNFSEKHMEITLFLIMVTLFLFGFEILLTFSDVLLVSLPLALFSHLPVPMDLLNTGMAVGNGQLLLVSRHLQDINMQQ